ncbi:MAG: hypothetical protein DHS20C21_20180 [Gemmatimonadota bacterium]|nr:MAG: hypothetical protein DHS20C21_20180 [Gemmatimonadota bacterium]
MNGVARFRPVRAASGSTHLVAAVIELSVLVALLVFLGIAAGKLFVLLGRVGIPFWKGAPIGILFVVAAAFTARRISARVRGLRRSEVDRAN